MNLESLVAQIVETITAADLDLKHHIVDELKARMSIEMQNRMWERSALPLVNNPLKNAQVIPDSDASQIKIHYGEIVMGTPTAKMHFESAFDYECASVNPNHWVGLFPVYFDDDEIPNIKTNEYVAWSWIKNIRGSLSFGRYTTVPRPTISMNRGSSYIVAILIGDSVLAYSEHVITCAWGTEYDMQEWPHELSAADSKASRQTPPPVSPLPSTVLECLGDFEKLSDEKKYRACVMIWSRLGDRDQHLLNTHIAPAADTNVTPAPAEGKLVRLSRSGERYPKLTLRLEKASVSDVKLDLIYSACAAKSTSSIRVQYRERGSEDLIHVVKTINDLKHNDSLELSLGKADLGLLDGGVVVVFDADYIDEDEVLFSSKNSSFLAIVTAKLECELPLPYKYFEYKAYNKADVVACADLSSEVYNFTSIAKKIKYRFSERMRDYGFSRYPQLEFVDIIEYQGNFPNSWLLQNTQVMLLKSIDNTSAYIVFRGSQELEDWIHDFSIFTYSAFDDAPKLKALSGFYHRYRSIKYVIESLLREHDLLNVGTIYVCGHSLGGALAHLTTHWLATSVALGEETEVVCYTFGAPPLINEQFYEAAFELNKSGKATTFNIIDPRDPVAMGLSLFGCGNIFKNMGYYSYPNIFLLQGPAKDSFEAHSIDRNYIKLTLEMEKGIEPLKPNSPRITSNC